MKSFTLAATAAASVDTDLSSILSKSTIDNISGGGSSAKLSHFFVIRFCSSTDSSFIRAKSLLLQSFVLLLGSLLAKTVDVFCFFFLFVCLFHDDEFVRSPIPCHCRTKEDDMEFEVGVAVLLLRDSGWANISNGFRRRFCVVSAGCGDDSRDGDDDGSVGEEEDNRSVDSLSLNETGSLVAVVGGATVVVISLLVFVRSTITVSPSVALFSILSFVIGALSES
mmetsp:Transcript_55660/g.134918  ORF Transcript_55660/g.134918 Transcript_55660/m.134918 type:complete len:224 (+) Transcript_55660:503-1174(+)